MIGFRIGVAAVLAAIIGYFFMPVLNFGHLGLWGALFLLAGVLIPGDESRIARNGGLFVAALAVFLTVAGVMSWSAFHAQAYADQLGPEKDGQFSDLLPPIDIQQAPLVSEDMAVRSAEKQLASVPALGSQVVLGDFQKQLVNGKLYWISFLQHTSFIKYFSDHTTPGYVRVSATDPTDVELVTSLNGKPLSMRYLPSGLFGGNLERHLYFHGYANKAIAKISPEVDESGRPYYVVTFFRNGVGFGGADASEVAIVDPQTGAIQDYALKDVPAWADIIQPADIIAEQISNRTYLVNGWFNPSDNGRLNITGEPDLVYGADGRAYWYVGLTSAGNDNGLVGFYLVDSRTKAARRFNLAGATEDVAEKAAVGVIPEKNYTATNALPFVVDGQPTYVFALRDDSGIPRAYAMVNIQTFQTLAVGDTLTATLRQYEAALSRDPSATGGLTDRVADRQLQGTIVRITSVVHQGNTSYMLTLDTLPGHILVGAADLADELPLAQAADKVRVTFQSNQKGVVYNLTGFTDDQVLVQGNGAKPTGQATANPKSLSVEVAPSR